MVVSPSPDTAGDDQVVRLRRLGVLARGLAHEISTPMQYIGDNARFLAESVGDLRGILSWYQACVRVLAQGRHAKLLDEMAAMEKRIDLEHLLSEMPAAILHSIEGIAQVSASAEAFREFVEAADEPRRLDLERALGTALTVSRNEWRRRAELVMQKAVVARVMCAPSALLPLLVELALAAASAARPGATVRVGVRRDGASAVAEFAADEGDSLPLIAGLMGAAATAGATLASESVGSGWRLCAIIPAVGEERGAA